MIACLAWGSLVWDPRDLPLAGDWQHGGPELPIEFVRQSIDGRVTLVIDPTSPRTAVVWAPMAVTCLAEAIEALRKREGTPSARPIGRWPNSQGYECSNVIDRWARTREINGVVWTALGPKFGGERNRRPSQKEVVEYLARLSGESRRLSEEYVRSAPPQIDTPYRRAITKELGWTGV